MLEGNAEIYEFGGLNVTRKGLVCVLVSSSVVFVYIICMQDFTAHLKI